jgi:uncharacterized protein YcfJ
MPSICADHFIHIPKGHLMKPIFKTALALAAGLLLQPAWAQITFYEHEGFRGRAFTATQAVTDFRQIGFNDRLSSTRWADSRRVNIPNAPAPVATEVYEYRVRPNERLFEANVNSVRAVVGQPTEHCWVERQAATEASRGDPNVGRGLLGAVIGGVIGHQIGGGTGRDLATVGGVVAGGVLGANSGRQREGGTPAQDVRRCTTTPSTTPTYWDVGYNFRGVQHQIQTTNEPGPTVTVNRRGEPRL